MTPNYDCIIEMICDRLCIGVITGFMGELYQVFNPNILKNPQKFYNIKDKWNDQESTIYDLDSAILNLVRQSRS